MLELIIGDKGKGKTRKMVERANNENKITSGSIIYIDKSNKHMYELSNSIRLINMHDYNINSYDAFVGFIQGLISSNYSLTHIFLDNFMTLLSIESDQLTQALDEMYNLSEKYDITFVISTAVNENEIDDKYKAGIICKL